MSLEGEFHIGEWLIKPYTNTISGPEGEARVEPKAMQVLVLLAAHPGEVVLKQDILTSVWDGTYVSDEVLPNAIWEVRKALGDDARNPRFIQTLPKKGYRLIAAVEPLAADVPAASTKGTGSGAGASTSRGRLRAVGLGVAAAAVLAVGAAAISTLTRSDDAADARDPLSVLVLNFHNETSAQDLEWLSSGAPTMLRTGLAEVPGLSIVSALRVDGIDEPGASDASRADAIRRTGAGTVVVGSVFQLGEEVRIDVQIEDVESERILAAHSARGEDVFQLMDELTRRVSDSLRGDASIGAAVPPLKEMTTSSLEAFRLFNEGVQARRHLRIDDARTALTEAVRIDPEFALAWAELQMVAGISRDEAAYEELGERVHALKDRLPPNKRVLLEVRQYSESRASLEESEAALLGLIDRKPDEEEAYVRLSNLYRDERSLAILERGATALPYSGYLRLLYGYALLREGRFTDAIRQFETYARIEPEEANPMDSLGEAYLLAGDPDRALEYYARALEIDPSFTPSHLGRSWAFAQTGRFDQALEELDAISELPPMFSRYDLEFQRAYVLSRAGRYRDARIQLEAIEARASKTDSYSVSPAVIRLFYALFALERGNEPLAMERAREARELLPAELGRGGLDRLNRVALLLEGIAACRSNRRLPAEHLSSLEPSAEKDDPAERWWYHLMLGEIALSRGEAEAAAQAFTKGMPERKMPFNVLRLLENLTASLPLRDGLARAKALAGDDAGAIAIYERLLRPDIGLMWTAMLEPRYHLELARLYHATGDREKASRHYSELLRLWSKADAELSELGEAEAYLASS